MLLTVLVSLAPFQT